MAVLQCAACPRFISVSAVPGGNPVAKADPERWSATRTVCGACGKSLCDRCAPADATGCAACGAALGTAASRLAPKPAAQPAPTEVDDDVVAVGWLEYEAAREARTWLALSSAAALLLPLTSLAKVWLGAGLLCWVVTVLAGVKGIRSLLRSENRSVFTGWLSALVLVLPPFNLLFSCFYLARAQGALRQMERTIKTVEQQREARRRALLRQSGRRREPAVTAAPAVGSAADGAQAVRSAAVQAATQAVQTGAEGKSRVRHAVACVKHAGLGGQPDGARLQARVRAEGVDVPPEQLPVIRSTKGEFGVFYAVDEGQAFTFVQGRDLEAEKVSLEDLHRIGLRNLAAKVNAPAGGLRVQPHGNFHALLLDGHSEASLVLLDALWDGPLRQYTPNGVVVTVPARDICAFCDARSAAGIAELQALAHRVTAGGDHLLSDALFVRHEEGWRRFTAAHAAPGRVPQQA